MRRAQIAERTKPCRCLVPISSSDAARGGLEDRGVAAFVETSRPNAGFEKVAPKDAVLIHALRGERRGFLAISML
jgi:hypothetical protein